MAKKVLGKGLAALIPEKETRPPAPDSGILAGPKDSVHTLKGTSTQKAGTSRSERIVYLKIEEIAPNKYQPRENFDSSKLEELVSSIREKGVVQPILVRRAGEKYELIAGERRLRAVKSLGVNEIPAIIKHAEDLDSLELSLIENIQRENLNPIEEAHAYQRLIDEFGFTQEETAGAVGKDRTSVANILRLLKLPQKIQEALKRNEISMGHGRALLGLENSAAQMEACKRIIAKGLSVREAENLVRQRRLSRANILRGTGKTSIAAQKRDYELTTMEEELQHILGTRVRIFKGKKRGKIEIEYYSDVDLERIIDKIR